MRAADQIQKAPIRKTFFEKNKRKKKKKKKGAKTGVKSDDLNLTQLTVSFSLERKNSSGFDETISPYHYRYPPPLFIDFPKNKGGISTEKFIKFAGKLCPPQTSHVKT